MAEVDEFNRLRLALEAELGADAGDAASARGRLFSRLVNRAVPVPFDNGEGGKFTIDVRLASPEIRRLYGELQMLALTSMAAKDHEKLKKIEGATAWFLGEICIDDSFDEAFWLEGKGYDVEIPRALIDASMGITKQMVDSARQFRESRLGEEPVAET